jgi:hypothetical protein
LSHHAIGLCNLHTWGLASWKVGLLGICYLLQVVIIGDLGVTFLPYWSVSIKVSLNVSTVNVNRNENAKFYISIFPSLQTSSPFIYVPISHLLPTFLQKCLSLSWGGGLGEWRTNLSLGALKPFMSALSSPHCGRSKDTLVCVYTTKSEKSHSKATQGINFLLFIL